MILELLNQFPKYFDILSGGRDCGIAAFNPKSNYALRGATPKATELSLQIFEFLIKTEENHSNNTQQKTQQNTQTNTQKCVDLPRA